MEGIAYLSTLEIIVLSLALGVDAFSIGIVIGATVFGPRQVFRLSFHFGLFQFMMPLIGWQLGAAAESVIGKYNHWIAFIILCLIGGKMLLDAFTDIDVERQVVDRTRKWHLVFLSIATSIDALGAGFGLGLVVENLLSVCIVIGLTAGVMTIVGMILGKYMKHLIGQRVNALGGIVLIILGLKILLR